MAPLHSQLIDTANQDCAAHMTVDVFTPGRHGDSFGTVDVLVSPPTLRRLARAALGTLKPLPIAMKTVSNYINNFTKERSHTLSLPPTRRVLMSSCLYVLVHHSDAGLGSMSRSNSSSIMSFTSKSISLFDVTE